MTDHHVNLNGCTHSRHSSDPVPGLSRAAGLFAVQNREVITVGFWDWKISGSIALLAIAAYALGMLSGWTVVAFVRRSLRKVREHPAT